MRITTGREGEWYPGGPQYIPYVNGQLRHGMDLFHRELRLSDSVEENSLFSVYWQAFSGVKDILTEMRLDVFSEETETDCLYFDLKTAWDGVKLLSANDPSHSERLLTLNRALSQIDFFARPGEPKWAQSIRTAQEVVQRELYDRDRSITGVTAHCVGHTHLDLAWLWRMEDTRRKGVRTFSNQVELLERYSFYTFVCTQPALYDFVEKREPKLLDRVKDFVQQGRWEPEGAMWVEPDCNLPSGESLVRQLLLGKTYFKETFGWESRIFWAPDTFGFCASLPQILRKAGVEYFATTKLSWNETNQFPYSLFLWRGIDGTEITTYFTNQHAAFLGPQAVADVWNDQKNKELTSHTLVSFGWGDAGNGATEEMLEIGKRLMRGVSGCPGVTMSGGLSGFLDAAAEEALAVNRLPVWDGELYLELHRGTLTSVAEIKKYNRRCEQLYHDAETAASAAQILVQKEYPRKALLQGWKQIALHQFHDILPGSSVREVYQEAFREYEHTLTIGRQVLGQARQSLADQISLTRDSVVVFNSLGFEVSDIVTLPASCLPAGMSPSEDGICCPSQRLSDGNLMFFARAIPSKGWRAFPLISAERSAGSPSAKKLNNGVILVETPFYTSQVQMDGTLSSLFDKAAKREVFVSGARGNVLSVFEDMPFYFNDAWDIASYFEQKRFEVCDNPHCEILEDGPVCTVLHVEKEFYHSHFYQDIRFYHHIPRIDFVTTVDWQETFSLLKVEFPVAVHAKEAAYDIQFGTIFHPTHRSTSWERARFEVCGHKWADLSQNDFGVSVLNDCKYGYDIH